MFVTVKYGEDQSKIFNINCRNEILLFQIKKRCQMRRDDLIELSDEHGTVKNLRQNLNEYGTGYLKQRETLILLRVDSIIADADGTDSVSAVSDKIVFTPMLKNLTDNQEFIDNLNPKDHFGSKLSLVEEDVKVKKSKNKDKKKEKEHKEKEHKEKDHKEKDHKDHKEHKEHKDQKEHKDHKEHKEKEHDKKSKTSKK